ncbi:MAG: hypothetical protein HKP40_13945 [Litoreibacter sp.]|nr:hypothetical protein [Litoreibacter sp.]
MLKIAFLACIALGSLITGPFLLLVSSEPRPGSPVLVLAPPWTGGASAVVQEAGLREIGPERAILAALADYERVEDLGLLSSAGAWFVIDGEHIASLCGV